MAAMDIVICKVHIITMIILLAYNVIAAHFACNYMQNERKKLASSVLSIPKSSNLPEGLVIFLTYVIVHCYGSIRCRMKRKERCSNWVRMEKKKSKHFSKDYNNQLTSTAIMSNFIHVSETRT